MTQDERLRILYGDPKYDPPEKWILRAGPLTLWYEATGDIRYVKWGQHEILRRVYGAVRDADWGTVPATVTEIERDIAEDHFRIVYEARHQDAERGINFRWRGTINGEADGTITFDFDGEALSSFSRNRIGLCVLHPADLKGHDCVVRHSDGAEESGKFPELIAPHQPFFDVAAITHEVTSGISATVTFAGDTFEMEDQRNWMDASYKTYSTPLALPYPVEIPVGTSIRQTTRLSVDVANGLTSTIDPYRRDNPPCLVQVSQWERGERAKVGLCFPHDLSAVNVPLLAHLDLDIGYIDLDFKDAGWRQKLEAMRELWESSFPNSHTITMGLHNATPESLPDSFQPGWPFFYAILSPHNDDALSKLHASSGSDEANTGDVLFVAGEGPNFTELNRNPPPPYDYAGEAFMANPQVHATDSISLMETPLMLNDISETIIDIADWHFGTHIYHFALHNHSVGPDQRQAGLIGATWATACVAYASASRKENGIEVNFFDASSGLTGVYAEDGTPYPVYYALQMLCQLPFLNAVEIEISDPLRIAILAIRQKPYAVQPDLPPITYLVLTNLTPETQTAVVSLPADSKGTAQIRVLDETNAREGFSEHLPLPFQEDSTLSVTLSAYAIAQISIAELGVA